MLVIAVGNNTYESCYTRTYMYTYIHTHIHTCYAAGTQIQDGEGKMLVIAVGNNTYEQMLLGNNDDDEEDEDSGGRSILQVRYTHMYIYIWRYTCIFICVYKYVCVCAIMTTTRRWTRIQEEEAFCR